MTNIMRSQTNKDKRGFGVTGLLLCLVISFSLGLYGRIVSWTITSSSFTTQTKNATKNASKNATKNTSTITIQNGTVSRQKAAAYTPMSCFDKKDVAASYERVVFSRVCAAVRNALEEERKYPHLQSITPPCNLSDGPVPVILFCSGRAGSTSTWETLGKLTGQKTKALEAMGESPALVQKFLETNTNGFVWVPHLLCALQKEYPNAGFVGFKWKTDVLSSLEVMFTTNGSLTALQWIKQYSATMTSGSPVLKVLRSRRNTLDVVFSALKHLLAPKHIPAQCKSIPSSTNQQNLTEKEEQKNCLDAHLAAGTSMRIQNIPELIHDVLYRLGIEDGVDHLFNVMGIPYAYASYEELYGTATTSLSAAMKNDSIVPAHAWIRLLNHIGVNQSGIRTTEIKRNTLSVQDVQAAMTYIPTHNPHHNLTIANHQEVYAALQEAGLEYLWH